MSFGLRSLLECAAPSRIALYLLSTRLTDRKQETNALVHAVEGEVCAVGDKGSEEDGDEDDLLVVSRFDTMFSIAWTVLEKGQSD